MIIGYGLSGVVRGFSPVSRISYWTKIHIFPVSPQEASFVRFSMVENMGGSYPLWYIVMSPGDRFPMEPSLVGAEGYDRASESGSEVGSSAGFFIGVPGSEVGFAEVGSLRDSQGFSSLSSEFKVGFIRSVGTAGRAEGVGDGPRLSWRRLQILLKKPL